MLGKRASLPLFSALRARMEKTKYPGGWPQPGQLRVVWGRASVSPAFPAQPPSPLLSLPSPPLPCLLCPAPPSPAFPAQPPSPLLSQPTITLATLARRSPAGSGSRGAAVVAAAAAESFVLGLSARGALQGHLPRVQAAGGPAARRVDAPHLGAAGRCKGAPGLRPEAVGGAQAAAGGAAGRPGVAVGLPDVKALLDERATPAPAREALQAPGRTWIGGEVREAARWARVGELPQV